MKHVIISQRKKNSPAKNPWFDCRNHQDLKTFSSFLPWHLLDVALFPTTQLILLSPVPFSPSISNIPFQQELELQPDFKKKYSSCFHATCSCNIHCALKGSFIPVKLTVHGTAFDRSALNFMQIFLTIREPEFIKAL